MISVHPFPARMAPELALNTLSDVKSGGVVLDPMSGSGTVAQQAMRLGLPGKAFDLDPLAVLLSKVATRSVDDKSIAMHGHAILQAAIDQPDHITLPWLDDDRTSKDFVNYWFAENQRGPLRKISYVLANSAELGIPEDVSNVLRVALSRIIITKKSAASLAQDTSHSRPHRIKTENDFDVYEGYRKSIMAVRKRLAKLPSIKSGISVSLGDARALKSVEDCSVDIVLTSPPYLNAIDYMRGHKMSLIWLGHSLQSLAKTRSNSIGAERAGDGIDDADRATVRRAMGNIADLPSRHTGMIDRYADDLNSMMREVARVLVRKGSATFVMGNSCLKGVYIRNSDGLIAAGELAGLSKVESWERDLPSASRYLPVGTNGSLAKRMRKEVIVRFKRP